MKQGFDQNGIRDYFVPGDKMTRRKRDVYLAKLAKCRAEQGRFPEPLFECPECGECETWCGFDGAGADDGKGFCMHCGKEVEPIDLESLVVPVQGALEFS